MAAMREQAARFGADYLTDDATAVDLTAAVKTVTVGQTELRARAVILATGSKYRSLGLPNERRLLGRGVSACATCDGFCFRGLDVAVVGGGDSAIEEATFLTRFSVTVVHRRGELRASRIMQQRAFANEKIRFVWHSVVEDILGEQTATGVVLRDVRTGARSTLPVAGIFIAIGHDPSSRLFAGQIELAPSGHVVVQHPSTRTSQPGVFACGDLVDHVYQQAITAAGTGAAAALDAQRWLDSATASYEARSAAGLAVEAAKDFAEVAGIA